MKFTKNFDAEKNRGKRVFETTFLVYAKLPVIIFFVLFLYTLKRHIICADSVFLNKVFFFVDDNVIYRVGHEKTTTMTKTRFWTHTQITCTLYKHHLRSDQFPPQSTVLLYIFIYTRGETSRRRRSHTL